MNSIIALVFITIVTILAGNSDYNRELREANFASSPSPSPMVWHVDTNCPVEDSCYPEYANGEWYIVEGSRE